MTPFFVHDADGRILRTGSVPSDADAALQAGAGETARIGVASLTDWWSGADASPRPALPFTPPVATVGIPLVIDGLPASATWRMLDEDGIEVGAGIVGGGNALEVSFGMPGTFSLFLGENDSAFPYLPRLSTITVTDP